MFYKTFTVIAIIVLVLILLVVYYFPTFLVYCKGRSERELYSEKKNMEERKYLLEVENMKLNSRFRKMINALERGEEVDVKQMETIDAMIDLNNEELKVIDEALKNENYTE